ncbi:hypothetical protein CI102_5960 [Trichoderma harzianum]|nr:hypothetical protein CI102_5960 [Trichoderma harzianum]
MKFIPDSSKLRVFFQRCARSWASDDAFNSFRRTYVMMYVQSQLKQFRWPRCVRTCTFCLFGTIISETADVADRKPAILRQTDSRHSTLEFAFECRMGEKEILLRMLEYLSATAWVSGLGTRTCRLCQTMLSKCFARTSINLPVSPSLFLLEC